MAAYSADFFNNVAAVSMVLIFAKFVTHRSRSGPRSGRARRIAAGLHVVCVVAAVVSLVIALAATELQSDHMLLHVLAWVSLGIASAVLIGDVLWEDLNQPR
jgi:hypothetical protein